MTPRPGLKEEGANSFFQNLVTTAASLVREAVEHDDSSIVLDLDGEAADNSSSSQVSGREVGRHLELPFQVLITVLYVLGIVGNMAALCIIRRSETQRYSKQVCVCIYMCVCVCVCVCVCACVCMCVCVLRLSFCFSIFSFIYLCYV